MEFGLLGPLVVFRDGAPITLGRGRPRRLLISLLLRVGRVVPSDVLIDHVWGERTPSDAANALQVQVSYLRRALGLTADGPSPALRTEASGYLLDVDPAKVDARQFEDRVRLAAERLNEPSAVDAELARDELRAALSMWRGEPLQDVAYEPFAVAEVERLRELHASALEYEIDTRMLLGEHDQVVPDLHQYVADHPFRERMHAQLVLALYRLGRQADALRALASARQRLVEELGVDPGRELQALERAVLAQDLTLDWRPLPEPAGTKAVEAPVAGLAAPHLPTPATKLVGRARELARIGEALSDNRLVTLIGPGGAGKTRLALELAHKEVSRRPVWMVELAEIDEASVVPFEIARAVGVASAADPLDAFAARLGERSGVLVLDTCEHLIEMCASVVHRLLRRCTGLHVLATSRQPLAVPGEVAWPVPPLMTPGPDTPVDDVGDCESVRLFSDRARAVRPDFELSAANADAVARICRVVDGLPLAVELAAARTRVLSPASILDRLDDRFTLLSRDGAVGDLRQQSLRAAIEWSYDLLDPEQQVFFDRLGVFAGRFTFDAAASVAADGLSASPLDLLTAMVDRSLVVSGADDWYRLLDSLRAFAADRLAERGAERDAAHERLACWLVSYLDEMEPRLRTDAQQETLTWLRLEVPNARRVLEWAFTSGDRVMGARLVCSLAWFWALDGAFKEASRWLRQALDVGDVDREMRARLLEAFGVHTGTLGRLLEGRRALREAVELWADLGVPQRGLISLIYAGAAERWLGEFDAAAELQDRAIRLARAHGDAWGLAWALLWRSVTAADQGDDGLAEASLAEAQAVAEQVGDPRILGWIVTQASHAALRRGDVERALDLAQQSLAVHTMTGWDEGLAAALTEFGRALVADGRAAESIAHHRGALRTATEQGQPYAIAKAVEGLAQAEAAVGEPVVAVELLGTAATVRAGMGVRAYASTQRGREVQELQTSLREWLGPERFTEAFSRGRRRPLSEAVAAAEAG